jgi:hypothetical protein
MPSGVGVCLMAFVGIEVGGGLEKAGPQCHRRLVCRMRIINVQIEMDLLRVAVRPVRTDVVRCELYAYPSFTSTVNNGMPTVILEDTPAEDPGPERALGIQVRCVEHDDLTHHSHDRIIETVGKAGASCHIGSTFP